jgi:methylmalonyl-CoA epimerase
MGRAPGGREVANQGRGWRVTGLHHVAFAHGGDGPEEALTTVLGLPCAHEEAGPGFVERMFPAGTGYLQTLEASGEGVVSRFLKQRGPSLHHVAFSVDGLEAALEELARDGVRLVDRRPRPGGMGTMVAFVHPSSFRGLLVELVETPDAAKRPPKERG